MKTKKVLLAIGSEDAEKVIQQKLPKEFKVVGVAIYKEQVLNMLKQHPNIDVLLLRENILGNIDVLNLVYTIRTDYPNTRIVIMTGQREVGDAFLSTLVNYSVYDILIGYSARIDEVISYIKTPRTFSDVAKYQVTNPTGGVQYTKQTTEKNRVAPVGARIPTPKEQKQKGETLSVPSSNGGVKKMPQTINNPFEKKVSTPKAISKPIKTPTVSNDTNVEGGAESANSIDELFDLDGAFQTNTENTGSKPKPTPVPKPVSVSPEANEGGVPPKKVFTQSPPKKIEPVEKEKPKSRAKILSTEDMDSVEKPFVEKRRAIKDINTKPMVLSVIGAKGGVGTTTVSFNLAISLAKEGFKTLYIELNDKGIPFTFNYQLENFTNGLEEALKKANGDNITEALATIKKMKELKKKAKGTDYAPLYNKYPDSLDYLAFSQDFILSLEKEYEKQGLSQLLMSALLAEGYQYIIIDIQAYADAELITQALKNSKGVFSVVTQNMTSVAQSVFYLEQIHEKVINLNKKLYFVVNQYENEGVSSKALARWIQNELPFKHEGVLEVPNFSKKLMKADSNYLPITLDNSSKDVLNAYKTLANYTRMF